jgi:hypothetical protein
LGRTNKKCETIYRTKLGQKKEQPLVHLTASGGSVGVSKEGSILIWIFQLFQKVNPFSPGKNTLLLY